MIIKEPYGFIYITTNMINGKRYIGQKIFNKDLNNYIGSGKTFLKAVKKYGKENFFKDIVAIAFSKEELDCLEKEWIKNYNAVEDDDFYNISKGGLSGGFKGQSHTTITRNKISQNMKGKKSYWKNKKLPLTTCEKLSISHKGIKNNVKKVICLTTNKVFNTIKEGAEFYNCNRKNIPSCCKGKVKSCGKLKDGTKLEWLYYDEYLKGLK